MVGEKKESEQRGRRSRMVGEKKESEQRGRRSKINMRVRRSRVTKGGGEAE